MSGLFDDTTTAQQQAADMVEAIRSGGAAPDRLYAALKDITARGDGDLVRAFVGHIQEALLNAAPAAVTGRREKRRPQIFKLWYAAELLKREQEPGRKIVALDHPIRAYCKDLGLCDDFFQLHWQWFKEKQLQSTNRQADWVATFCNSVRGNYGNLWCRTREGTWRLTTTGKMAALRHGFPEDMESSASGQDDIYRGAR